MTNILLRNARLARLFPAAIEVADLRISDGLIQARGVALTPEPGEEVIDLTGKLVLPGLVCAHTHLYSSLARGMPAPKQIPGNFHEILKYIWWRLDRALDEETIYWSAIAGGLDAIRVGATTLIDHHASPACISNSLGIVREALAELGLRSVLCYEVTDRSGETDRDLGLAENRQALVDRTDLCRALVGAHAAFTLNADSLQRLSALAEEFDCGVHIHVGEDRLDETDARDHYQMSLIERLDQAGLLRSGSILAHCTHLDREALKLATQQGCWLIHNARSNMNNSVGYAQVREFGDKSALGTDGIGADMFEEAKFAFYKARDAQQSLAAEQVLAMLAGGQRLAGSLFNLEMSQLVPGAAADLIVLDYYSPTPLTAENFAWHFIFGMSSAQVSSTMVKGKFLLHDGQYQSIAAAQLSEKAQQAALKLWRKMESL